MRVLRVLLGIACVAVIVSIAVRPAPRPNVIVVVMDTTRGDRCSFAGYARPTTPRLAEFAEDAVVFRDAWSPAGWTAPGHASLFTGLRPENHDLHRSARQFLDPSVRTLARQLSDAGWATACFSNNVFVSPDFGLTEGFDVYEPADAARPYPYSAGTHARAAAWAETQNREGRPFFLFINDMEPHMPYEPPAEFAARFVRGAPSAMELAAAHAYGPPRTEAYDLRAEELTARQIDILSDLYDAEIATLDAEIGHLFDRLRASEILDSAVVIVTSDHGEYFGENHMMEHGLGLHRAACHVPLLIRSPGKFDGGRVETSVVRLEDLFPTVLELAGLDVPGNLDGVSLLRDLTGRIARGYEGTNADVTRRLSSVAPRADVAHRASSVRSAYDGRHHLLDYGDGTEELFDVLDDPSEARNLAARLPGVVTRLKAALGAHPAK